MKWWVRSKKNVCRVLNYIENLLTLVSAITYCISTSAFLSLVGIFIGITSCAIGLEIYAITAGIKKSVIRKKKKTHDKIVLIAKDKLNSTEILIPTALTNSYISQDEFVLVNKVLREYYDMKG